MKIAHVLFENSMMGDTDLRQSSKVDGEGLRAEMPRDSN